MFVRYFVYIPYPYRNVMDLVPPHPKAEAWLPGLSDALQAEGHRTLAAVGFPLGPLQLRREVEVELGALVRLRDRSWITIIWRAGQARRLFPVLEGELEWAPLGDHQTVVGLNGDYEAPPGVLGGAVDRAIFHRAAEATVKSFVELVAANLEGSLHAGGDAAYVTGLNRQPRLRGQGAR